MNGLIRQDNVVTIPFWSQAQYRKYRIVWPQWSAEGNRVLGRTDRVRIEPSAIEFALSHFRWQGKIILQKHRCAHQGNTRGEECHQGEELNRVHEKVHDKVHDKYPNITDSDQSVYCHAWAATKRQMDCLWAPIASKCKPIPNESRRHPETRKQQTGGSDSDRNGLKAQ